MGFFDNNPFYKISTPPSENENINRLNQRYEKIIKENITHITNKRIIDLGSHNGRWTWACLESGAEFVLGIEGREAHINEAIKRLGEYDDQRYALLCGDASRLLMDPETLNYAPFDTILCLGIFYHVMDHFNLFRSMARLNPSCIIIDSGFVEIDEPMVKWQFDNPIDPFHAIADRPGQKRTPVGVPSTGVIQYLATVFRYDVKFADWNTSTVTSAIGIEDYLTSKTMTWLTSSVEGSLSTLRHRRHTAVLTKAV